MNIQKYKKPLAVGGVIILAFILLGVILPTNMGNLLSKILIMMLFATSVNIMFGYGGMVAFGQAIFFGVGAYAYTLLAVRHGVPLLAAFVLAVVIGTLLSVGLGLLVLRVQAFTFGLLFMGLNILFYNLSIKVPQLGSGSGVAGDIRFSAFKDTTPFYFFVLAVVSICYFVMYVLQHSSFSNIARGVRENEERMAFLGVNVKRAKLILIIVASFFASIAGVLYAMLNLGAYTSYFNTNISTQALVMCLVGGMTAFWGPSIGAVIITIVTTYISNMTIYYNAVLGIILIVTILFFPSGILGRNTDGKGYIDRLKSKAAATGKGSE